MTHLLLAWLLLFGGGQPTTCPNSGSPYHTHYCTADQSGDHQYEGQEAGEN